MQPFHVPANMSIGGVSYRVGDVVWIDPAEPGWADVLDAFNPLDPADAPEMPDEIDPPASPTYAEAVHADLEAHAPTISEVVSDSPVET